MTTSEREAFKKYLLKSLKEKEFYFLQYPNGVITVLNFEEEKLDEFLKFLKVKIKKQKCKLYTKKKFGGIFEISCYGQN